MDEYFIAAILLFSSLIIFFACLEIKHLQSQLSQKGKQLDSLSHDCSVLTKDNYQMKAEMQRKKDFSEELRLCKQKNQEYILQNISKIYFVKDSLMYQPEQKAFYFLNCDLYGTYSKSYCVFPQVSISAFIDIFDKIKAYKRDTNFKHRAFFDCALRNITSKSVDFLICEYKKAGLQYFYVPRLVIELDGSCHYRCWKGETINDLERRKANDKFKNTLFESLHLTFRRIDSNNSAQIKREDILQILQKNLSFKSDKMSDLN